MQVRELFCGPLLPRWPAVRFVTSVYGDSLTYLFSVGGAYARRLVPGTRGYCCRALRFRLGLSSLSFTVLVVYLPLCVLASRTVRTDVLVLRVGEETSITSAWWRDLCLSVCLQGSRLRTRHTSSRTRDLLSGLSSWCFLSCPDGMATELSDLSSRLECVLRPFMPKSEHMSSGSRHNAGYHRSTASSGRFPQVWQRLQRTVNPFGQLLV